MNILRGRVKVNVGCGKWNFGKDWISIDQFPYSFIKSDDIKLSEFKDNSIDLIYSSHFLEYFHTDYAIDLLKRWYMVLKKGGKLQIAVPDFKEICEAFTEDNWPVEKVKGPVFGFMYNGGRQIYHSQLYDIRSLSEQLYKAGFTNINQVKHFEHKHKDQSWAYLPDMNFLKGRCISLNVECYK